MKHGMCLLVQAIHERSVICNAGMCTITPDEGVFITNFGDPLK